MWVISLILATVVAIVGSTSIPKALIVNYCGGNFPDLYYMKFLARKMIHFKSTVAHRMYSQERGPTRQSLTCFVCSKLKFSL